MAPVATLLHFLPLLPYLLLSAQAAPAYPHANAERQQRRLVRRRIDKREQSGWNYYGCVDETTLDNPGGISFSLPIMVPEVCMGKCEADGFDFAALQGDRCSCGSWPAGSLVVYNDERCDTPCPGNADAKCGAEWYLSLYTITPPSQSATCVGDATTPTPTASEGAPEAIATTETVPEPLPTTVVIPEASSTTEAVPDASSASEAVPEASDTTETVPEPLPTTEAVPEASSTTEAVPDTSSATEDAPEASSTTEAAPESVATSGTEAAPEAVATSGTEAAPEPVATSGTEAAPEPVSTTGTEGAPEAVETTSSTPPAESSPPPTSPSPPPPAIETEVPPVSSSDPPLVSPSPVPSSSSSVTPSPSTTAPPPAETSTTPPPDATADANVITTPTDSVPPSDEDHFVWAHFMLGNTYSYTAEDWKAEIDLAKSFAIDGFALNLGPEDWQLKNMEWAYSAAEAAGDFKMFLSIDFAVQSCSSSADAERILNLLKKTTVLPAQAMYDGKAIVSTFLGEQCTFGGGGIDGWETAVFAPLEAAGTQVYFVPFFSTHQETLAISKWVDGGLDWNSGWPMGDEDISSSEHDDTYINALSTKGYMPAVSPFFFTHFGADTYNKNWIYRSDNWLYCTRWEEIIQKRTQWTMTEILTWNDWGESSYIGKIRPDFPPTSEAWVKGFEHTDLGILTKFYSTAYKTGAYPAIEKDSITLWSRPHAAMATASDDPVGRPERAEFTEDNLYAAVLATAPAQVTLISGSTSAIFQVPAGLSKIKMPSAEGSMGAKVERDGATVLSYDAGDLLNWTRTPVKYNYNYLVGGTSA